MVRVWALGKLWEVHDWDAHVGGRLRVSLDFDQGPYQITGTFLAVEPPNRLR